MPVNNFNVGRDVTLQIVGYDGLIKTFNLMTQFNAKQETNRVKIKGIDGTIRYLEIPDGWTGSFKFDRADRTLDDYFAQLESDYYSGINVQAVTITETIAEVSGAISQYRYTGVQFKYDDAGDVTGDKQISQSVSWCGSRRLKVQ